MQRPPIKYSQALVANLLILASVAFFCAACDISANKPLFAPKQLAYAENALEPIISTRAMQLHHGKHYAGYIKQANRLVKTSPFKGQSLVQIIQQAPKKSEHSAIFNQVAQAWNHEFFFEGIKPQGGGVPQGALLEKIRSAFGSFEAFKADFLTAAGERFGSGWVWLVYTRGQLKIVTTANADTPLAHGLVPLFAVDLWEHAYYLDYENRKLEYVQAVIDHLANWDFVTAQLKGVPQA